MSKQSKIQTFESNYPERILFRCRVGSRAYGTHRPESDYDSKGIFILPATDYMKLLIPPEQVTDERADHVLYSLRRFMELASTANPNIIEMLFMPDDCILFSSPVMDRLIDNRSLFITQMAYESHVNYARAQIKKARGQNKWINNPQPRTPPEVERFCWFVPRMVDRSNSMPLRPMALKDSPFDLNECHCSSLEHAKSIYRIYHYGEYAKGIFRNGQIVCESIPKEDEDARCVGLLIVNLDQFERALRDHRNYWEWMANRNPDRWKTQETGQVDYDPKNMMHTFRLLLSGENILKNGAPRIRFYGEDLEFLKSILAGKYEYEYLIRRAEDKVDELAGIREKCKLPTVANLELIDDLLSEMTTIWEKQHAI